MSARGDLRIMLVEDSADDVFLVRQALKRSSRSIELLVAEGVAAALTQLRAEITAPIDLLLVDLNLPGASGFELLRELQAEPGIRPAQVVVFTSSVLGRDQTAAKELGADAFQTKPSRFGALVEVLGSLVRELK